MGLLDLRRFELAGGLLAEAGLTSAQIPEIHAPGDRLGELKSDVAAILGLTPGLPVIAGTGDGQAAGLGADITAPGVAFLNLGTGIVSRTFSTVYPWSREFRTMTGAVPGTYLPETFIGGGTYNVSWFVEQFSGIAARPFGLDVSPESILDLAAAKVPAGSDGLLALLYLSGALSPYWDSNARGVFLGLSARHGKSHLYRALLEGPAMEQRLSTAGAERALGVPVERFRMMGGGSRSPLWCQIFAGMLAAAAVGLYASIAEAAAAMSGTRHVYQPDEPASSAYDRLYDVYRQPYPTLRETFAKRKEVVTAQPGRAGPVQ